jgi:emfourin
MIRRGGLAGVRVSAEFDTDTFDDAAAARVEEAIERLLANGPPQAEAPPYPDAFAYEITLPDRQQSVSVGESALPSDLRPMLRELTTKGRLGTPPSSQG